MSTAVRLRDELYSGTVDEQPVEEVQLVEAIHKSAELQGRPGRVSALPFVLSK